MTTSHVIHSLVAAAAQWLAPHSPWRARAVAADTGFSPAMVEEIIRRTFAPLTVAAFEQLLAREAGGRQELRGPKLIAHFLAGNIPAPAINSICFGLLLQSHNVVKLSGRDRVFPALFVESLRAVDAALAAHVELQDWRRDDRTAARALLARADAVIVYGTDETVATLRQLARPDATFLGYGHKLSFGIVGGGWPADLAVSAAEDVCVYDQHGCMSPHVFYVGERAREFAARLAAAMAEYQQRIPLGRLSLEAAAAIARLRGAYEFRAAFDPTVAVWSGPGHVVIFEQDTTFATSCLNRVVFVKPSGQIAEIAAAVRPWAGRISTIGLWPLDGRADALGAHRVCAIGQMQRPQLWEPHDGQPNLAALLR